METENVLLTVRRAKTVTAKVVAVPSDTQDQETLGHDNAPKQGLASPQPSHVTALPGKDSKSAAVISRQIVAIFFPFRHPRLLR